ncbi:MAG: transcriptional regulator [Phycisphaeraceae bacterium]|nr:MAG: transcriptional regulator [Phycisphaeraceae bacterium]
MTQRLFELHEFDLPAHAPAWHETNQIRPAVVIAFARAPVMIQHEGGRAMVADQTAAMLYNPGQRYRRGLLDERGDNCLYLALPEETAREVFGAHDAAAVDRAGSLAGVPRVPTDAGVALSLARLRRAELARDRLAADSEGERLIDAIARLAAAVSDAPAPAAAPRRASTRAAHEDLVERTRAEIARTYTQNRGLADIAGAVHASAFHLARVFREHTGESVCAYRNHLRLRAAGMLLVETREPITRIAHRTGFATHAHMTTAFGRLFGVTPTELRCGGKLPRERARI